MHLFRTAVKQREVFPYYGPRNGIISTFKRVGDSIYQGTLALFTDIDTGKQWLDFTTGQEASDEDLSSISIPKNLRPEFVQVAYVFNSKKHLMLYVSNGLGATSARRLMQGLLGSSISSRTDVALEVTIVQDEDELQKMLREPNIVSLSIEVKVPNADDLKDLEDELEERLRKMQSKSMDQTFVADSEMSIIPDNEAIQLSTIALKNGKVETKVRTDKGIAHRSTLESPKTRMLQYDPQSSTEFEALVSAFREYT